MEQQNLFFHALKALNLKLIKIEFQTHGYFDKFVYFDFEGRTYPPNCSSNYEFGEMDLFCDSFEIILISTEVICPHCSFLLLTVNADNLSLRSYNVLSMSVVLHFKRALI